MSTHRVLIAALTWALALAAAPGGAVDTEATLNRRGYELLRQGDLQGAIRVFESNVAAYPGSANVYDSLAEAYERTGKLDLARTNYEKAVAVGLERNDPNVAVFKANLARVVGKLEAQRQKSSRG